MQPRTLAAYLRWTGLLADPADPPSTPPAPRDPWTHAQRAIAARLALALARERLVDAELGGGALRLRLRGGPLELPLARAADLELHTPDLGAPRAPLLDDPTMLFRHVAEDLSLTPLDRERVAHELADSAFNLALAHEAARRRRRAAAEGRPWPAPHDPENLVEDGHPWHPMCRTRLGLTTAELLRHAPEHLARGDLALIDIRADLVAHHGDAADLLAALLAGHGPPPPPGFVRLPVHLAQRPRLRRRFPGRWGADLRPAPAPPLRARALLSLRTVALAAPHPPLHLKVALDVVTTSARRTVSPMSVANGPPLAALLAAIQRADPATRGALRIQGDRGGVGLRADLFGDAAAHLGLILRDDPSALAVDLARDLAVATAGHDALEPARAALPPHPSPTLGAPARPPELWVCAALGERRPTATRTLLHELVAGHGGDPRALLRDYVDRLLPPVLRLFTAHGVALEAHLQNTLAVVDRGRLLGFVVRDLGGLRVHRGRLLAAGHHLSFEPGSFIVTDDLAEARDKLAHTLFHAHLAALFRWAEADLAVPAAEGWALARAALLRALAAWRRDPALLAACDDDRAALLAPRARAKALFTMRLGDRSSDYAYVDLDNPLARPEVARAAAALAADAR